MYEFIYKCNNYDGVGTVDNQVIDKSIWHLNQFEVCSKIILNMKEID